MIVDPGADTGVLLGDNGLLERTPFLAVRSEQWLAGLVIPTFGPIWYADLSCRSFIFFNVVDLLFVVFMNYFELVFTDCVIRHALVMPRHAALNMHLT